MYGRQSPGDSRAAPSRPMTLPFVPLGLVWKLESLTRWEVRACSPCMGRVFSWVPRGAHWQWPSAHTHTQTHTHTSVDGMNFHPGVQIQTLSLLDLSSSLLPSPTSLIGSFSKRMSKHDSLHLCHKPSYIPSHIISPPEYTLGTLLGLLVSTLSSKAILHIAAKVIFQNCSALKNSLHIVLKMKADVLRL